MAGLHPDARNERCVDTLLDPCLDPVAERGLGADRALAVAPAVRVGERDGEADLGLCAAGKLLERAAFHNPELPDVVHTRHEDLDDDGAVLGRPTCAREGLGGDQGGLCVDAWPVDRR